MNELDETVKVFRRDLVIVRKASEFARWQLTASFSWSK